MQYVTWIKLSPMIIRQTDRYLLSLLQRFYNDFESKDAKLCPNRRFLFLMQCVELLVAQLIAILRVQKPENAPFLPSENRFSSPSEAYVFVSAKIAVLTKMCKRPIQGHYQFVWKSVAITRLFVWKNVTEFHLFGRKSVTLVLLNWRIKALKRI